jgi:hypothetical protein
MGLGKSRCDIPNGTTQGWACLAFKSKLTPFSHHMNVNSTMIINGGYFITHVMDIIYILNVLNGFACLCFHLSMHPFNNCPFDTIWLLPFNNIKYTQ